MKSTDALCRMILTFMGVGNSPWIPGTVGSLAALLMGFVIWEISPESYRLYLFPLMALVASFGCVICGPKIESLYGRKDPGAVVIDEVAGQYVALSVLPYLPVESPSEKLSLWILAFLLFRIFDIWKPLGIRRLEKLPEGWGVLMDDIAAGIVAALCTIALAPLLNGI